MRYICCVWLCIVWLVCHAQTRVNGLHIQQAPEIIQRITRQATRYSSGSGAVNAAGSNYRPIVAQPSNYNVRNVAADSSAASLTHTLSGNTGGQRISGAGGVGAYSFGGMASGRPTNGNSFAINSAAHSKVVNTPIKGTVPVRAQPQVNPSVVGNVGKPNQLQQALLQAAQYQLMQKHQFQQPKPYQQQLQYQQLQQQPQSHRRQVPQQAYRQRPAVGPASYEYQQFN